MACEYCGRESCQAYATSNGFAVLAGDERTLAEIDCRNATRDRALRAEAELDAIAAIIAIENAKKALSEVLK